MARGLPLALLLATLVASGCSGSSSAGKTVSGWFGGNSDSGTKGERVYYAAVEGLEMRAEPSSASRVVASLRLREKVIRTKEKNGYAFVRARGGSLQGWVLNSKLDWRSAAAASNATTTAPSAAGESPEAASAPVEGGETVDAAPEPVAGDVEAVEVPAPAIEPAAAPVPPPPPAPEPARKKGIGASVFDPY